ncbi:MULTISPECIES: cytidine deaminase [Prevotellaceae]|jgi:cytidine deaminase|uniref:cytidine deaminase n=1 Tax=Leyella stercorea TaxID=363265 RepID=UPI001F01AC9B|nr:MULTISPECIES: cytidine deaminase [Prevotellaceae]MCF2643961.1 cytidine deaminase [Leyella stercorea]MCI6129258.1 cytidine deaminase [Prevotella sp.]MCI7372458.1 cytidine deaminase [Prevotella sp.]MDY3968217.1 cytidine deaminase [Prevotella sp.]MDY4645887.1 cytidine deaminase [Prevotella sp.]
MKTINLNIAIKHCQLDELSVADRELIEQAMKATDNAYAEYSHFYVGAALRLANGRIVIGANQENAAFPSGLCAERTAVFSAQANFPDQSIEALALVARNDNGLIDNPVTPCGACRQVLLGVEERYGLPMRILMYGKSGVYSVGSAKDLLPLSFVDSSMK